MEIFKQIAPLKDFLNAHRRHGKSIGLVPTMGALHTGHLSLIEASKADNDITVTSIYVNPTQFNNPSDLEKYPRTLREDVAMLEKVGCDALFCPDNNEMYPSADETVKFDFGTLDKVMEGEFRPGHFSGVALVVSKLFNIVQPDHAYFGQKDFQQFAVIHRLTVALKFDLVLHSVPTAREHDGLAMSSRNLRLSADERKRSVILYRALTTAKKMLHEKATISEVKAVVNKMLADNDVRLEYFEVADGINLSLLQNVEAGSNPIMCIAAFVGDVRLIDNMYLN